MSNDLANLEGVQHFARETWDRDGLIVP